MRDIGSLLLKFGAIARNLEEIRLLDWQNSEFGYSQSPPVTRLK
jgi:hypothetical protein